MWCLPSVQRPWFLPWLQCELMPYSLVSFLGQIVAFRLQNASMWVIYSLYLHTCIYNHIQYTHRAFWHNLAYHAYCIIICLHRIAIQLNGNRLLGTELLKTSMTLGIWLAHPSQWNDGNSLPSGIDWSSGCTSPGEPHSSSKPAQSKNCSKGTMALRNGVMVNLLLQVLQWYSRYLDYTIRWTDIWKTYSQARISGHTYQKHFIGLKRMVAVRASQ